MRWIFLIVIVFNTNSVFCLDYKYPSSRRIDIDSDLLAKCMLDGEQFDPKSFMPSEIYQNNRLGGECDYNDNDFFKYLSIEAWRICDYETGNEQKLRKYILNQADNSIDPVSIFKESMRINKNHIFNSLLTIHQLLRNEARWRSKGHYFYDSTVENENLFWNKFLDIRGIEDEDEEADHPGSWYRLWGIALYRFAHISDEEVTPTCVTSSFLNDTKTSLVGITAELLKYALDFTEYSAGGDRAGKSRTNISGAHMASHLIKLSGGVSLSKDEKIKCSEKRYLRRNYGLSPNPHIPDKSGY